MNFKEIKEILESKGITPSNYDDEICCTSKPVTIEGAEELGPVSLVESHGGGGEGENYYVIGEFIDHGVFVKVHAHYQSYDGCDWSDSEFTECEKVPATGFVYREK